MELELKYQELNYKKRVLFRSFTREETFEVNLSETQPDAVRTICATASPYMRTKDAENGRMTVSGSFDVSVLYAADSAPAISRINLTRDFSAYAECDEISEGSQLTAEISVASAEARLINSRKLHVKVELLYTLSAYESASLSLPSGFADPNGIESMTEITRFTAPASVNEKTFAITDEQTLSGLDDIAGAMVSFSVDDVRRVGAKAVVRGMAKTRIVYTQNSGYIAAKTLESPFSQVVDLDEEAEYTDFLVTVMGTGAYVAKDQSGESDSVSLELHGVIQCVSYKEFEAETLCDAYSISGDLSLGMSSETLMSFSGTEKASTDLSCEFKTPQDVRSIDAILAFPGLSSVSGREDRTELTVPTSVTTVYSSQSEEIFGAVRGTSGRSVLSSSDEATFSVITSYADAEHAEYNRTEDGIAVRFSVKTLLERSNKLCLNYISSASIESCDENEAERPSLIAYRVQGNDSLWSLAKRYRSTADSILSINGLNNESELFAGKLILIAKN